jgi:hypothetical protein
MKNKKNRGFYGTALAGCFYARRDKAPIIRLIYRGRGVFGRFFNLPNCRMGIQDSFIGTKIRFLAEARPVPAG